MGARSRLAVGWLTLFVVGTDLFVVSPLLPLIARDFRLSAAAAGLCTTAFSLTYMIGAPFLGGLADRLGRVRVLSVSLTGFALANLLTAAAAGFGWLILARIAAGATAAGVTPLIYAGVGEAAPPGRRATWMALAVSGLLLALSLGAPLGSLIGAAWDWRVPFALLGGLSALLVAVNRVAWSKIPRPAASSSAVPASFGSRLARRLAPTVLWATALYGMYTYLGVGLTAAGLSPAQIARAISIYGVAALAGTLLGGQAADRIGVRQTMLASLVGLALGLGLLGRSLAAEWSVDLVLLLTSVFAQLFFPAQQSALARDFAERPATALAWNNSALFLGVSLGAVVGGQATTRAGFAAATAVCAVVACVAIAVVALGRLAPSIAKTPLNSHTGR